MDLWSAERDLAATKMKGQGNTRSQLLALLREHDATVRDLARHLRLTKNAVRAQLAILQRESLIRRAGSQIGKRKPHIVYTLTENAAHAFPNAYGLLLRELVAILAAKLNPQTLLSYLRELGRQLASEAAQAASDKSPRERRRIALEMLGSLGGEASLRNQDGIEIIEGRSCPLAIVTGPHPEACVIAQTALSAVIGGPVRERCVHGAKPRCRFEL